MSDAPIVERVARAICDANGIDPDKAFDPDAEGAPMYWTIFIPEARASILAMREPTDAMALAGEAELLKPSTQAGRTHAQYAADQWRAMIDEALKG
jgi:hypothetical protein